MKKEKINKVKDSTARKIFVVGNYILLLSIALLCVLPFINLAAISFSGSSFAEAGKVGLWPKDFNVDSYKYIFKDGTFFKALGNSMILLAVGIPWQMLMTILMAYPLSRPKRKFKGRKFYVLLVWVLVLFSAGIVPEYMLKTALKLDNSIWALILPGVPIFNVILLTNFFKQIPEEIHDAAEIDGCSEFRILIKMYVPLSLPAILTTILLVVVELWNSYLPGILYMSSVDLMPLQSYLHSVLVNTMDTTGISQSTNISQSTIEAARLFMSIIPILAFYLPLQKYFVQGMNAGGVKE